MSVPLWVRLLRELRRRRARPVRSATLSRVLAVSPGVLSRELKLLARHGWRTRTDEADRLTLAMEGPLIAEEIKQAVSGRLVCRNVEVHEQVGSTQDLVRAHAAHTDTGGPVTFAERQSSGRGRFGRKWKSGSGRNLLFSTLLRLPHSEPDPSVVMITASVAVCETLFESLDLPARIRWPNDVLLAGRKVAGVLVERTRPRRRPPAYLVGIGLNVNETPGLDEATSVAEVIGEPVDRTLLACALLEQLERWYRKLDTGHAEEIVHHWRRHSSTLGRRITVLSRGKHYTGRVVDMCLTEGLTLQLDSSLHMTFRPEDATLVHEAM